MGQIQAVKASLVDPKSELKQKKKITSKYEERLQKAISQCREHVYEMSTWALWTSFFVGVVEAALCVIGCLAPSVASTHWMPGAPSAPAVTAKMVPTG